jgi:hypothetical protein
MQKSATRRWEQKRGQINFSIAQAENQSFQAAACATGELACRKWGCEFACTSCRNRVSISFRRLRAPMPVCNMPKSPIKAALRVQFHIAERMRAYVHTGREWEIDWARAGLIINAAWSPGSTKGSTLWCERDCFALCSIKSQQLLNIWASNREKRLRWMWLLPNGSFALTQNDVCLCVCASPAA